MRGVKAKSKPKETDKVNDRKAFIKFEAIKLFAASGYEATTMDALSDATGLNKGTLYYYFSSKTDILYEICMETIQAMYDAVVPAEESRTAVEGLRIVITKLSRWSVAEKEVATVLFQEQAYFEQLFEPDQFKDVRALQRKFMKLIYSLLSRGIQAGELKSVDVKLAGMTLVGTVNSPYSWQLRSNKFSHKKVADHMCAILLNGLAK